MHAAIRERVVFRNIVIALATFIFIVITHELHIEEGLKLVIDLLILIWGTCLALWMEYLVVPDLFRRRELRLLITEAGEAAEQSSTLERVLDEIVQQLGRDLSGVKSGFYTDQNDTIPELSLLTIQGVSKSAFATFVADEREAIYNTGAGKSYIEAWYTKGVKLAQSAKNTAGQGVGLHRIFIVQQFDQVSDTLVDLIQDHLSNHVQVSVIERRKAEALASSLGAELDFALFDNNCLMTVKSKAGVSSKLSVFVDVKSSGNAERIARYRKFQSKLVSEAKTSKDFLSDFLKPTNQAFWAYRFREHGLTLGPPHGLSETDAKQMLDFVLRNVAVDGSSVRVGILGMTPVLVEVCEQSPRVQAITLVDQSNFESGRALSQKTARVDKNWLKFTAHPSLDAVLGDESLNNLSSRQYRSFFRAMHAALRPGGVLIMRTLGRFGDTEQYLHVPPQKVLEHVRHTPQNESDLQRAEKIIGFLHSREIAYSDENEEIDTSRYNSLLTRWVRGKHLTSHQAERFYFPDHASPRLRLSSPSLAAIHRATSGYFRETQMSLVDGSYCGSASPLRMFYRIMPFIRSSGELGKPQ